MRSKKYHTSVFAIGFVVFLNILPGTTNLLDFLFTLCKGFFGKYLLIHRRIKFLSLLIDLGLNKLIKILSILYSIILSRTDFSLTSQYSFSRSLIAYCHWFCARSDCWAFSRNNLACLATCNYKHAIRLYFAIWVDKFYLQCLDPIRQLLCREIFIAN